MQSEEQRVVAGLAHALIELARYLDAHPHSEAARESFAQLGTQLMALSIALGVTTEANVERAVDEMERMIERGELATR